jgi:hypothetical protein
MNYRSLALAAMLCAFALPGSAKTFCGTLTGREYDYRVPDESMLAMVNNRHFTDEVEQGVRGSTGTLGNDLEYTLRVFPNHYRALNTVLRVAPRFPTGVMPGSQLPTECFFERAVRVFPNDSTAWLMYAQYQFMMGREAQSLNMLNKAIELSPDDPTINYNLGLLYAKQKKYEQALPYAQKAYAQNFPLPGLKQNLSKAGKWVEPPAPPAEEKADKADKPEKDDKAAQAAPADQPTASVPPVKP